ncbi:cellulose-binding domain-containing protein [Mycobacterium angelicum]|uniref:CBM2 domain-containing protein n=1 Tax=Mycobacterium angelicum TaxID=470074 RepID=A0A1X0A3Q4_MYCAN|nr:cellulose-binding domain-containing protein [Mycobacterium angelicum]MCV7197914.1 cellulose binding domain-containing protein [Mycobacterium angelicum]ORA24707.1 hypothetical protein BST12_04360 [Mycobacterium angelicum]
MSGLRRYEKLWRPGLHVALSAFIVAILALGSAPVANAAAISATLSVQSQWQTGFIARGAVTNLTMAPLSGWKLEFDLPANESVLHPWNSTVTQSGTHWTLGPANFNYTIPPGGSVSLGFRGALIGNYSPPVNCRINGLPCS